MILSQVRLPIPPQWHMRLHEKHHTILWKQMQEVFAKALDSVEEAKAEMKEYHVDEKKVCPVKRFV